MSQVYRVGRDRVNDIILDDATVSRAHAELRLEADGDVLLVDLDSTNGTCVRDGNKWIEIDRATIDADERILIGDVVTTVDSLLARRDALLSAAAPDGSTGAEIPPPANDSGRVGADHARLLFRRGRGPSGRAPSNRLEPAPTVQAAQPRDPALDIPRRAPSFRAEDGDHNGEFGGGPDAAGERETPSLLARRIGQRIGQREQVPSLRVEANPARRVKMPQRTQRRWVKPAVLSAAASFFLVAAIAAVVIHGPDGPAAPPGGTRVADGSPPPTSATPSPKTAPTAPPNTAPKAAEPRKDATRVVGNPATNGRPAGMIAFGGAKIDSFRAVAAMPGGGFLAVGSSESGGAGGFDIWLVRTDAAGVILWEKRFGGAGDDYGLAVAATEDGGAVIGGAAEGRKYLWLIRIDDKGDVRWSRRIDSGYRGHVTAVAVTRDGYAATAVTQSAKGAATAGALFRLDRVGNTVWRRNFDGAYHWVSDVRATYGAFVVAGVTKASPVGPNMLWVAKVDVKGQPVWSKRLPHADAGGGAGKDAEAYVRMARRGDIIVATTHQAAAPGGLWPTRHARLVRLDRNGKVIWRHMHKGNGRERVGGMVLVKGGIILAGTTSAAPAPGGKPARSDLWLARIDTSGKTVWERRLGGAGADGASGFAQTGRTGFVVVGTTDAGAGRGRDGLLVTLDREGKIARKTVAKKD